MTSPYTSQPLDALMAAQSAVGFVLAAIVWFQRTRPKLASALLTAAIALLVLAPVDADFWHGIGLTAGPLHAKHAMKAALLLAVVGVLLARRAVPILVAIVGSALLWKFTTYAEEADNWLAALNLCFVGVLVGLHWRELPVRAPRRMLQPPPGCWVDDVALFAIGTAAAAIVSVVLLHRWNNSGDEWANTYQAAVFAKFRAYAEVPRCSEAFRSFWVFQWSGRSFAQYTPGWPLFMTPFTWLSAPWLAGPVSLGLLAAATCRLGRRAASCGLVGDQIPSASEMRVAGRLAGIAVILGPTMLINGASRYPHVFTAATFAWAVEALCAISWPEMRGRGERFWAGVLGVSAAMLLATRPGDGATLGLGMAAYFAYAAARGRVSWRSFAIALLAFSAVALLTLTILRLQIGKWFSTGYSLTGAMYDWAQAKWSVPKANEYRWGVPLDTGSYCWWPCAPAVGLAGLMLLKGRARGIGMIFLVGYIPFFAFYTLLELGRGWDLGYGPRYIFPAVLPMAVGTGLAFARMWTEARARFSAASAVTVGGPVAVALASALLGIIRIAPLVYPITQSDIEMHNRLRQAIEKADLHRAIVLGGWGISNTDPKDLPEDLPLDLYPDQNVLIADDTGPQVEACIQQRFPEWRLYRAIPGNPVTIVPY